MIGDVAQHSGKKWPTILLVLQTSLNNVPLEIPRFKPICVILRNDETYEITSAD